MAVEARHLNILFPPQILGNREMMMMNGNACNNYIGVSSSPALETVVVPLKNAPLQSDSGLTYAAPRKRGREFAFNNHPITSIPVGSFFLGEDISPYLLQQQSDIDRFIAQYTDKLRLEMQRRRSQYSRGIAATVEESMMKKLKAKEEEIEKIGKLNSMLEERVKSLSVENQIWREVAQSNEATANALRSNLEQVLAAHQQVQDDDEDAQSSCNEEVWKKKNCRRCGREESCVLILPCRHLCVCTACSSSVDACPVCNSTKTRTLHVNLSYS